MQYTLLEIVQLILASLEDDEVDSIGDTETAQTVAGIVKQCYYDIIGRADLPELYDFYELSSPGDITRPTVMVRPATALNLTALKYNNFVSGEDDGPRFRDVTFLPVNEFVDRMYTLQIDADDGTIVTFQDTVGAATIDFIVYNDRHPTYYTTSNGTTIYFDSYMNSEDSWLVSNKSLAYGLLAPVFQLQDTYVPALDPKQFQLLINEAKGLAHYELKQTLHAKAEKTARQNWISLQKRKRNIPYPYPSLQDLPNYGRK